jgi:signal transduction histidine kinase
MGGTIAFDSEEGKGTTFRLTFPRVAGRSAIAA